MSETPRVDLAECLIQTDEQVPVAYVLSSVAKELEIELSKALADLKAMRRLLEEVNIPLSPKDFKHLALTATPEVKPSQSHFINQDGVDEVGAPRTRLIEPTTNPKAVGKPVEYTDGEILFNKGDNAKHLAIVLDGAVEIFDPVGNVSLAILGAGCAFGEQAILEGGVREASVRALGNVKCLQINTESLRVDLVKSKGLLRQIIEGLLLQLSMCNQISKMLSNPEAQIIYELLKNERLTTAQVQNRLRDAVDNPDSSGLPAEQMTYLKLQSSEKLTSHWFRSGKVLGGPSKDSIGCAYVITDGSVDAQCGNRTICLGRGSVIGLAEGITSEPHPWTLVAREHLIVKVIPIDQVLRDLEHSNVGIKGIVRYTTSRILELEKTFSEDRSHRGRGE